MVTLQYGFINYAFHSITNIDSITSSLSMFNQGVLLLFKGAMLIGKGSSMLKLIWNLNSLATAANSDENEKWVSENRRGELIAKAYLYACWISVACVALVPWLFVVYEYVRGLETHLELPFALKFPFDDGSWPSSLTVYILTMLHLRGLSNTSIGIDTLFGWYIFAISGHFRILRDKIAKTAVKIDVYGDHTHFQSDIKIFVRYHDKVAKYVDDLNDLYGAMSWAEIAMSTLQMCFLLYSLGNDPNPASIPFHFVASASIVLQLMIYCFGGEKLTSENDMLCNDIYMAMPWDKMYPSEIKAMLILLVRAQRETILKGLFFNLNQSLLVFIFKTAFSLITLLGAIKE
ncbi:odorant receptor 45a-like [Stomoxys calcitrans]|uniref:odorant receptor 45a-like n=1 Tax=Stomoxys calcitrans TaxID=35570 RepID=UPI0027E350D2|nr:odorant receptor 45a-like [Stomoxys calcitrans]